MPKMEQPMLKIPRVWYLSASQPMTTVRMAPQTYGGTVRSWFVVVVPSPMWRPATMAATCQLRESCG